MKEPFKVSITNVSEIRMGSPYNLCDIELVGFDKVKFSKGGAWQDKYAWRDDFKKIVFIKWDLEGNIPGFQFVIIDIGNGEIVKSHRIFGLVNYVTITDNLVHYNKFLHDKSKPTDGDGLCCYFDEEFEF